MSSALPGSSPWPPPSSYLPPWKQPADVSTRSFAVCPTTVVPTTVSVAASPSGGGELAVTTISVIRNVATVTVTGGVAGRVYTVSVTTAGGDGSTTEWLYYLPMSDVLAADPPTEPPNAGFGTPIIWTS